MSDELVIAVMPGTKLAKPYSKAEAERLGFEVLKDEPIYVRGRIRSPFRTDGRQIKPKRRVKSAKAIPTSTSTDGGESAESKE